MEDEAKQCRWEGDGLHVCGAESGSPGTRKTGWAGPSHRLLCLRCGVGGDRAVRASAGDGG